METVSTMATEAWATAGVIRGCSGGAATSTWRLMRLLASLRSRMTLAGSTSSTRVRRPWYGTMYSTTSSSPSLGTMERVSRSMTVLPSLRTTDTSSASAMPRLSTVALMVMGVPSRGSAGRTTMFTTARSGRRRRT